MKFLQKINRQYLLILIVLLILISISGYFLLRAIIKKEIREDINEKEYAIIREIKLQNNLVNIYPIIETKKISGNEIRPKSYREIYMMDEAEGETEAYLEYTNPVKINNQWYLIKIRHSLLETNDLILAIALPLLLLLVLTFSFSFLITKKLNKTVWKDFEENSQRIQNYSFKKTQKLTLKNTGIEEFDRINDIIIKMTGKLREDYFSLKEFTENASHEIQTPLSIVLLNLEELLQQNLSESELKQVVSAINAIKRLSALNQSLLLLAKIENDQFDADNVLVINDILRQKVQEFAPLFEVKKLKVELNIEQDFTLKINRQLAEILISNLLSNAVKHNIAKGSIQIAIDQNELRICNTGTENSLTDKTIFNRFTKDNSESYGLGLAIVQKICGKHHLEVHYFKNKFHCFIIHSKL